MAPRTKSGKTVKSIPVDRKAIGRASAEKGRKFEDKVADLYRLLGAEVTQNIEIHEKKVDILAEFPVPGSNVVHKVIVECKDEAKAVDANGRVMAFNGLLSLCRKAGIADSGEIITKVPWSDQAKGFAKEANICLLTFSQKLSQLLNFKPYLKDLVNRFEIGDSGRPSEPPLSQYYVDLSAAEIQAEFEQKIPVINSYIAKWLETSVDRTQLAIFGEYGAGKSTLCQKTAYDLALMHLLNPDQNRIPIILNLRDFVGKIKIEAFITSFLDSECNVNNPRYSIFHTMNAAGCFLLIFDGLDEMAVKVDSETLEINLQEIEKLASPPKAKVILTSRPEHFISVKEEQQFLTPQLDILGNRDTRYQPLRILAWDDSQIDEFLKKRVSLIEEASYDWTYYGKKIRGIVGLQDLSKRPVLLDMIVKTLPRMIRSKTEFNLPNLYETYLSSEIRRQKVVKKREFMLTEANRMEILRKIAINTYFGVIESISFNSVKDVVQLFIGSIESEIEAQTRDFLTNSFLLRKGDQYVFSHTSIYDYLVAKALSREIGNSSKEFLGKYKLSILPIAFLRELNFNRTALDRWVKVPKYSAMDNIYLGGNAATLLTHLKSDALADTDLSGLNLTGASLDNTNLKGSKLENTVLKDAQLNSAQFDEEEIKLAKFSNTRMGFYFDWHAVPKGPDSLAESVRKISKRIQNDRYNILLAGNERPVESDQAHFGKAQAKLCLSVLIPEGESVEGVRKKIRTLFPTDLFVYDHEVESLFSRMNAKLSRRFE